MPETDKRAETWVWWIENFVNLAHEEAIKDERKRQTLEVLNSMKCSQDVLPDDSWDEDSAHRTADELLLDRLTDLGEYRIVEAYKNARENVRFWYS